MPRSRAPRPRTMHFNAEALYDLWSPMVGARDRDWEWDASLYGKPSRNLSADRSGLETHFRPLKALLTVAPNGFPAHGDIRQCLLSMQEKSSVLKTSNQTAFAAATEAANVWRVMMRDVYDLRKNNKPIGNTRIQELVDMIHISHSTSSAPRDEVASPTSLGVTLTPTAPRTSRSAIDELALMFPDLDGDTKLSDHDDASSEAEITSMVCTCPLCHPTFGVPSGHVPRNSEAPNEDDPLPCVAPQEQAINDDQTQAQPEKQAHPEKQAQATQAQPETQARHIPIPNAESGGQKRDTQVNAHFKRPASSSKVSGVAKAPKMRLRSKTEHDAILLPTSKGHRQSGDRLREAYLLDAEGKYIAGQSEKGSAAYHTNIIKLQEAIDNGEVTRKSDAKRLLAEMAVE